MARRQRCSAAAPGTLVAATAAAQPLPDWPRRRFSAITADAQGALWACLPDGERWRVAELSPEGRPQGGWRIDEPASELAMCERTHTLYIAAADSGAIYAARSEHGSLQRLTTVPKGSGRLGGLAVDGSGGVWAALRGGWSVVRFAADGSMDRVLALPVPSPTAVAIGGADGDSLFITSERHALAREALDARAAVGPPVRARACERAGGRLVTATLAKAVRCSEACPRCWEPCRASVKSRGCHARPALDNAMPASLPRGNSGRWTA